MEVDEEEDNGGFKTPTPVVDRKKATPRRRLLSSGKGKGKSGVNMPDESQRLISVMFSKNILGVERLSEDNQKGNEPKPKI